MMSDPRKQLEDGTHPDIVWDDYHAGKNPIDVLCDHLDEIERLQKRLEEETTQHLLQEIKTEATLDAVRFAVMLAGQSIVEAHGEDSAAYEAIQSVAKALEDGGEG